MKGGEVYSRVSRRMWCDERFCGLSRPEPSARELWLYLLTGPRCSQIPGLVHVGVLGLADDLDWPVDETRRCLDEIVGAGMAHVDHKARLIWLPKAVRHNWPANSSIVLGWAKSWRMLPECALREDAAAGIESLFAEVNQTMAEAFRVALGRAPFDRSKVPVGRRKGKGEQEHHGEHRVQDGVQHRVEHRVEHRGGGGVPHQEQEQEQEQEQDQEQTARAGACVGLGAGEHQREPEDIVALVRELSAKEAGSPDSFAKRCEDRLASGRKLSPAQRERLLKILDDRRRQDVPKAEADPIVARALELYGKLRDRRVKGEKYVWTSSDAAHVAKLVTEAKGIASREESSPAPEDIVERAIRSYLEDQDQKLRDERWPLAWLPSRMTRYPLLKARRAPKAAAEPLPTPPPSAPRRMPPRNVIGMFGSIGRGGSQGPRQDGPSGPYRSAEEETRARWSASAEQARALGIDAGPEPDDLEEMQARLPGLQKSCLLAMESRSATA